jgi:hypothetical protein
MIRACLDACTKPARLAYRSQALCGQTLCMQRATVWMPVCVASDPAETFFGLLVAPSPVHPLSLASTHPRARGEPGSRGTTDSSVRDEPGS